VTATQNLIHQSSRGLDVPITGAPEQRIDAGRGVRCVALLGDDYHGLRARLAVAEGDPVRRGELLFEDRYNPGVRFTSPGAGRVTAIHRGARRALRSLVVELSEAERSGTPAESELELFSTWRQGVDPAALSGDDVRALLVESGLWTALRTRPFSKVPPVDGTAAAVFVNGMDTRPHAPEPDRVCELQGGELEAGLQAVAKLTEGTTYVCLGERSRAMEAVDAPVQVERFAGPHPAGTAGVHIHTLAPVGRNRTVWTLGYQDVIAIGRLLRTGVLPVERVVALAGPCVRQPRLLRTRLGASLDDLCAGELEDGELRVVSGSVLDGKKAMGEVYGFLGRADQQVSVLREDRERPFLGWLTPGAERYSILPTFLARVLGKKSFALTTSANGSPRNMVPIGLYERVMPMDILPTYLLRSLAVGDIEQAEKLGALELDEEDLALCTFVCPGKTEYGPMLRVNLERMEQEG
jgi:Na+-transporting NADH:ubiquinone oxidoreductase subunit A